MLAHGEQLVRQGDPDREIPACVRCHGPTLTGMEPAIPGLLGLRPTYISAQLGAWRYGTRTATAPDCMQIVAGHLTEDDVKAVAAYLSSQPAPPDLSSAAKDSYKLPPLLRERAAMKSRPLPASIIANFASPSSPCWSRRHRGGRKRRLRRVHQRPVGAHRQRRIFGAGWRLHCLPYSGGRQALRWRPRDADPVRHALHVQYHAGQRDRHRHLDGRPVLSR